MAVLFGKIKSVKRQGARHGPFGQLWANQLRGVRSSASTGEGSAGMTDLAWSIPVLQKAPSGRFRVSWHGGTSMFNLLSK